MRQGEAREAGVHRDYGGRGRSQESGWDHGREELGKGEETGRRKETVLF